MKKTRTVTRKRSATTPLVFDAMALTPSVHETKTAIVPTGIPYFDNSLAGGFPAQSAILLGGNPGAGKTIFGMTFLANGAEHFGEKGAYISFSEGKEQMYANMKRLGIDLQTLEDAKKFWYMELYAATGDQMG